MTLSSIGGRQMSITSINQIFDLRLRRFSLQGNLEHRLDHCEGFFRMTRVEAAPGFDGKTPREIPGRNTAS
jgi:hypothetical protein